jgi:hypothetical protein
MAAAEDTELVVLEDGPIGRIELNRVEEGNALTRQMMSRLAEHVAPNGRRKAFIRAREQRGEVIVSDYSDPAVGGNFCADLS